MTLPTQEEAQVLVTVGVDTHLDEHVAVALDHLGRRLDVVSVPKTEAGYARLLKWAEGCGELERVGVEGAGSFGAGLSRFLRARGVEVLEVGRPKRRDQHRSGSSASSASGAHSVKRARRSFVRFAPKGSSWRSLNSAPRLRGGGGGGGRGSGR